jgi:DNA-binding NarL/FixJ family response regulator
MSAKESVIKLIIVDDHPVMRQGLSQLINQEANLSVTAEASSAEEALTVLEQHKPELALVDLTLPGKSGIELIKDIRSMFPEISVLVISMHDESLYAERVLRAGGRGYVMKDSGSEKILEAIQTVVTGKIYVSEKISNKILEIFSGNSQQQNASPVESLTDREFEIFQLIGRGLEIKDIAAKLHISPKTVEVHRLNIKTKLKQQTATELIRYAIRWVESED